MGWSRSARGMTRKRGVLSLAGAASLQTRFRVLPTPIVGRTTAHAVTPVALLPVWMWLLRASAWTTKRTALAALVMAACGHQPRNGLMHTAYKWSHTMAGRVSGAQNTSVRRAASITNCNVEAAHGMLQGKYAKMMAQDILHRTARWCQISSSAHIALQAAPGCTGTEALIPACAGVSKT